VTADRHLDGPLGLLERVLATGTGPARALDRLPAIDALRRLLVEQEDAAVIAARRAGCTWAQLGAAVEASAWHAYCRWREQVRRADAAGLVDPQRLPPPCPPVDPSAAGDLSDARTWCMWCGHRLVTAGSPPHDGWAHNAPDGLPGELIDVDCSGPEPWPAWAS
jgi:hypothetical protein